MKKLAAICLALTAMTWTASAQDDDKGFLVNKLQELLSSAGREVQINGFEGTLSSRATMAQMTIADEDGIWLTLEDVVLDWNRSALLRGRLEVTELTAASLSIPRGPKPDETVVPDAEAGGFSLPDLPVSVEIEAFKVERIDLGEPLLGSPASLSLTASAMLADGSGSVDIDANRIDGTQGRFEIAGGYDADGQQLDLDLDLAESPGGILARLINLPDRPSVDLAIAGSGPLDDYTADISLATDGEQRLAGNVILSAVDGGRGFNVDLGGDVTALFLQQYRDFFGPEISLTAAGTQMDTGALSLDSFDLTARAVSLSGQAQINENGFPDILDITGRLASPDGNAVTLPLSGSPTLVQSADLAVKLDPAQDQNLTAQFDLIGLDQEILDAQNIILEIVGNLDGGAGGLEALTAAINIDGTDLSFADPSLQDAIGATVEGNLDVTYAPDAPLELRDMALAAGDLRIAGDAVINSLSEGFATELDLALNAPDLTRFSSIAGRDLGGAAEFDLDGALELGGIFDVKLQGTATDLTVAQAQADAILDGETVLDLDVARNEDGTNLRRFNINNDQIELKASGDVASGNADVTYGLVLDDASIFSPELDGPLTLDGTASQSEGRWTINTDASGPLDATARVRADLEGAVQNVTFNANLPDASKLSPQLPGALELSGSASTTGGPWEIDVDASGPYDAVAMVDGSVGGDLAALTFDARLPDASRLTPQLNGPLVVTGTADQTDEGWRVVTDASGPFDATANVSALLGEAGIDVTFEADIPNAERIAPQLPGRLQLSGTANNENGPWQVEANASGPYRAIANVDAEVGGDDGTKVRYDLNVPNLATLVPELTGPLTLQGTAEQTQSGWQVNTDADGPAGTQIAINGTVSDGTQLAFDIEGNAPLGLANPFIAPRSVQGPVRFDLRVDGPPALSSVTGQIRSSEGRVSVPSLQTALRNLTAAIDLDGSSARLDLSAEVESGGQLRVSGPVGLSGGYNADLAIALRRIVLVDPELYRTRATGDISIEGPLRGGAAIAGQIELGQTDINVPSSGATALNEIPDITHIGSPRPVQRSRARAGLEEPEDEPDIPSGTSGRSGFGLDLRITAPNRIFVRGRGLDAELGGELRIIGSTAAPVTVGRFDLVRGRLDILSKRFGLDEGSIQLQGGFDPYLRFVATNDTSNGTASVIIEGNASAPRVSFVSDPDAPEDEVLAKLFFGRDVAELSAFQALQLASAVASLSGRGGDGIVTKLRREFDLDDLDIISDPDGGTAVRAGKYISENVYTDVTIGDSDSSSVSLNLDISPSVTARGKLQTNGDTSLGVFFERDY